MISALWLLPAVTLALYCGYRLGRASRTVDEAIRHFSGKDRP